MASPLILPALVVICVFGPVLCACVLGYFIMRHRTVFAVRVPAVVLACMSYKTIAFALCAWMFLDPNCPCAIASVLLWFEGIANYHNILRKVILLFRYELQDALEKGKQQGKAMLDERNVYVKYRRILKSGTQYQLMLGIVLIYSIGFYSILAVFNDLAGVPCLEARFDDHPLFMWSVILTYAYLVPLIVVSTFTTRKLKNFPRDHWKMYAESAITSQIALIVAVLWIVVPATFARYDAVLFVVLWTAILLPVLNFLVPLQLHRKTVAEIARVDLKNITQLYRLMKEPAFLKAFEAFLKSEFSSENLFFWVEVEKLATRYKSYVPPELLEKSSRSSPKRDLSLMSLESPRAINSENEAKVILTAANECVVLGHQCVGDAAPWQINISGPTAANLEQSIENLEALTKPNVTENQIETSVKLLEDALRCLIVAQDEVYEGLRRDSYPRFTLTPAWPELNKDDAFKRTLANEKLDQENPEGAPVPQQPKPKEKSKEKGSTDSDNRRKSSRGLTVDLPSAGVMPFGIHLETLKEREGDHPRESVNHSSFGSNTPGGSKASKAEPDSDAGSVVLEIPTEGIRGSHSTSSTPEHATARSIPNYFA